MVSIKKMLEDLMQHYDLTQVELANRYKISKSQVSRWLAGKTAPRAETYDKLKEDYEKISTAV